MKKRNLVLMTFVPVLIGYLINTTIFIPVIGMLIFYVVPFLTIGFWFYLGSLYSETTWNALASILIGNAIGILSLLLYLWQFLLKAEETRNLTLAAFSQMFSAATPLYLFGKLAILFETEPNSIGRNSMVAMQVISLVFMIVIFTCGYFWGRKHREERVLPGE